MKWLIETIRWGCFIWMGDGTIVVTDCYYCSRFIIMMTVGIRSHILGGWNSYQLSSIASHLSPYITIASPETPKPYITVIKSSPRNPIIIKTYEMKHHHYHHHRSGYVFKYFTHLKCWARDDFPQISPWFQGSQIDSWSNPLPVTSCHSPESSATLAFEALLGMGSDGIEHGFHWKRWA